MRLEALTPDDRTALAPFRAEVWRGKLSVEEFCRRNQRLYAHPFGQTRMHTFGFRDHNRIPSSLDAVEIGLLVGDGKGGTTESKAWHIASVLTLTPDRGRGLATRMLGAWIEEQHPEWSTLFSGIGPGFYERLGYGNAPVWESSISAKGGEQRNLNCNELTLPEFAGHLRAHKQAELARLSSAAATFYPDGKWWSWLGAIYQFNGETRGLALPTGRFWQINHDDKTHIAAGCENAPQSAFDTWWVTPGCQPCLGFIRHQANSLGMDTLVWWSDQPPPQTTGRQIVAMLRSNGTPVPLVGTQLGDWW